MSKQASIPLFALLALFSTQVLSATAAGPVRDGHVEAQMVSEVKSVQPGATFAVGVHFSMDPEWHIYWRYGGDAGLPTTVQWELPEGFQHTSLQWPYPEGIYVAELLNLGYEDEVLLIAEIQAPDTLQSGSTVTLKARVDWLMCKEACIPGSADLELALAVAATAPGQDETWSSRFEQTRINQPLTGSDWSVEAHVAGDVLQLVTTRPADWRRQMAKAVFYPYEHGLIEAAAPQKWEATKQGYTLTAPLDRNAEEVPVEVRGILVSDGGWDAAGTRHALEVVAQLTAGSEPAAGSNRAPGAAPGAATWLLAFLGGLVLNLMPCVFPVLGLKIMSFVQQAGEDRRRVTMHGLVFTLGVLVSFWVLSGALIFLRAKGESLGWGFQLQEPGFVFVLAVILLLFALNLSGLFEVGTSLTRVGGSLTSRSGLGGSFFTGVLATIVATPCAAPLLAPAIGVALTLSALDSLVVFTFIALGLATPYLLLSVFPGLISRLPRPGPWMETFKQLMAFLLYATVAYLVWVLAAQVEEKGFLFTLFALVLIALATWVYGRWSGHERRARVRRTAAAAAVLILLAGIYLGFAAQKPSALKWEPWSEQRVAELRAARRPVYVDFTARWCATCQVNKGVLATPDVTQKLLSLDAALLKADWTNRDPAITEALERFGRSAVPVNLYYAPGATEPLLLPEVLTPANVMATLNGTSK